MPRPVKRRLVCDLPSHAIYGPLKHISMNEDMIVMSIEEFETIRLIDFEGLDQEQCAENMEVARSTVQRIYNDARKKIAESLVNGKTLRIEGGNYKICSGDFRNERCGKCRRHQHGKE
ncbi:MAG: hypothetical protein APF84_07675 [Gracilibacter sp. BRH_c7a]|nr:MAG: hypothetical protein APF84_19180 [Gracilibacter sp. BRH_c7a]KUO65105.1 MAG: hypothetical protein APF84_07675 [Gracilibacter sp. BRH_c7a]